MSFIIVDVESDGPVPPLYSMISFGAVVVEPSLTKTFFGQVAPISENRIEEAAAISGISREEHESYEGPEVVMKRFAEWISNNSKGKPVFVSDNNGFDFPWINYYFHKYIGDNPFGWSSRRIGDIYCGMQKDAYSRWKHLRETKHNHHPLYDAKGNAEVLLKMKSMGLKIRLK